MQTLLTLSKDFDYGELVRMNYDLRPVETCYLPFFEEAISMVQSIAPDAILLHLTSADFAGCASFLNKLVAVQQRHPGYAPKIFVSEFTAVMLNQMLVTQPQLALLKQSTPQRDAFIRLEEFPLEVLIELLGLTIESPQTVEFLVNPRFSSVNPFDSLTPALAC